MIYGLYLSATGVLTNSYRQDVIANNLANLSTIGFKASSAQFSALSYLIPKFMPPTVGSHGEPEAYARLMSISLLGHEPWRNGNGWARH